MEIASQPGFNSLWASYSQTANEKLKKFVFLLLLWEVVLILSLTFLFYKILWIHLKEREENRNFLEMLVLTISHKLGNLLSAQRVNLEILKEEYSLGAVKRLEAGYRVASKEFHYILKIIEGFKTRLRKREKIDLKSLIEGILADFKEEWADKSLEVHLVPAEIYAVRPEIETLLYLLLENALKYSRKVLVVKLTSEEGHFSLTIKNDLNPLVSKGSGVGLKLARRLAKENRIRLFFEEKEGYFTARGEIPKKSFTIFSR